MAIQKQKRKIIYTGQTPEEEDGEESSASIYRVQKKAQSEKAGRPDENGDELWETGREEAKHDKAGQEAIKAEQAAIKAGQMQNVTGQGSNLMEQRNSGRAQTFRNQPDRRNTAEECGIFETEEVQEKETIEYRRKDLPEGTVALQGNRHLSGSEVNPDERIAFSNDVTGERIVRMDEVRRFRKQRTILEEKKTSLSGRVEEEDEGRNLAYDTASCEKKQESEYLGSLKSRNRMWEGAENLESMVVRARMQESVENPEVREARIQKQDFAENQGGLEVHNQMQKDATSEQVRYETGKREIVMASQGSEQNAGGSLEVRDGDSGEWRENPDRVFHRGRNSFYRAGNQQQGDEAFSQPKYEVRYGTRNFSKNSRRMEAEINAGAGQSFGQTQGMGREIRKTEQKAREAARDAQHTAREAGKTAGKTVGETIDSISQYSELVTRPYETGKRTFSAGKETVSKQFQSVKEMASSAKDVDETIGSKSKELLKAMAVRTFREAVTLPVRLARAVIKTATTVAATISTGGINLIIMLIALIFAGAVLVSIIVFAGTMLIAYGVSEGLLSF